jgi:hypothetical protein
MGGTAALLEVSMGIRLVLSTVVLCAGWWASGVAGAERSLAELQRLIGPQPGESLWMEIDWHTDVWEARRLAAAEGKPILVWAGSGGGPAAVC